MVMLVLVGDVGRTTTPERTSFAHELQQTLVLCEKVQVISRVYVQAAVEL
jgi:hypothetical protein